MYGNACQPGGKGGAAGKLIKVLIGAHVSVLHYIFSFGIIVQDRPCDPVKPLVVPPHDDLVQGGVAGLDPIDNLLIRAGFGLRLLHSSYG